MVLTNPPFGKKASSSFVTEEGEVEKEDEVIVRDDFWTATKNKQLNFLQHIYTLLKIKGRAAVVVPDNVLFEGGAGETIRDHLLKQCDVHTLLRLPTGIFYKPGVKANILFFEKREGHQEAWTNKIWVYDLRTNKHFTLKKQSITREDFDEFVECYKPGAIHDRKEIWSEDNPDGRWRCFTYEQIKERDKLNLDLFWIRDQSLEDSDSLPDPSDLATEIVDDLQDALEQFSAIAAELNGENNNQDE
jgi:type I restriction enzyme M protein